MKSPKFDKKWAATPLGCHANSEEAPVEWSRSVGWLSAQGGRKQVLCKWNLVLTSNIFISFRTG